MQDNLTQSDIDKMEKEIEYRKLTLRPKLIEDVKIARAHGDLSENFEYYAAKREKNMNESRIRYLDRMVRTANIIDDSSADDEVGINNTVTVEIVDEGAKAVVVEHSHVQLSKCEPLFGGLAEPLRRRFHAFLYPITTKET